MKQIYSKPIVTRVELKAEEALGIPCKTSGQVGNGYDIVNSGCIPAARACRDSEGS